jgi:hypothetical protein
MPDDRALPIVNMPWHSDNEIKKIYLDYLGCVPEPILREFVRAATGDEQPERGMVSVLDSRDLQFMYGNDPVSGDLIFVPMRMVSLDAPLAAAAAVAGTWGRFLEMEDYLAGLLRNTLTRETKYPTFGHFRRKLQAEGDTRTRAELLRAFAALDWRIDRPPRPSDRFTLQDLSALGAEGRIYFYNPVDEMFESLPWYIYHAYVRRTLDYLAGTISDPRFVAEDEEAIIADMERIGCLVLRDQLVIDCFLGLATDLERVKEHIDSYNGIVRQIRYSES